MNPLKLRKIYSIKRKAMLLGMKKQRKMDEKEFSINEERIKSECDNKIEKANKKYQETISEIRKEEKNYYEPLVKELKNKIADSQKRWNDSKDYFNAITQYGIKMEETGEQAADQFQRASIKLTEFMGYIKSAEKSYGEVLKHIDTGKSKIEYAQVSTEKTKEKISREII